MQALWLSTSVIMTDNYYCIATMKFWWDFRYRFLWYSPPPTLQHSVVLWPRPAEVQAETAEEAEAAIWTGPCESRLYFKWPSCCGVFHASAVHTERFFFHISFDFAAALIYVSIVVGSVAFRLFEPFRTIQVVFGFSSLSSLFDVFRQFLEFSSLVGHFNSFEAFRDFLRLFELFSGFSEKLAKRK